MRRGCLAAAAARRGRRVPGRPHRSPVRAPAPVTGARTDGEQGWAGPAEPAEHLDAPICQESFGARAGFPHGPPRYADVMAALSEA